MGSDKDDLDVFCFDFLTHSFCVQVNVSSFRVGSKLFKFVVEALVVNEVSCAIAFLEGLIIYSELIIELGVINEVKGRFDL
jgi:hypothetical protein